MINKITIYSLPNCEFCKLAKKYLKSRGSPYKDVDVDKDPELQKERIAKSGQFNVSVIDMNGQIIVGFQKNALALLLKK